MEILPLELKNTIYSYVGAHPLATAFKQEIEVIENETSRRLYWKATDEYIRTTYLLEDEIISFILEGNIRTRNIGRFNMSHNGYVDNYLDYDTEVED